MSATAESMRVQSGEIGLAVRIWRNQGRPTIVFLHGYPDDSSVWERLIPHLLADYEVVVYDVRGHGESTAPAGKAGYRYEHLVADLAAVIDAVSPTRPVHLVAHDWGSLQGWEAVTTERLRGRIASYVSLSGPCLDHAGSWMRRCFREGGWRGWLAALGQLRRSWYVFFFQLPWLAPLGFRLALVPLWPRLMWLNEGIRIEPNPHQLRNCLNGINLYRANVLGRLSGPRERRTDVPVLVIVAKGDPFISPLIYDELPHWVTKLSREDVDSGHWFPLRQPEQLAASIRRFCGVG